MLFIEFYVYCLFLTDASVHGYEKSDWLIFFSRMFFLNLIKFSPFQIQISTLKPWKTLIIV